VEIVDRGKGISGTPGSNHVRPGVGVRGMRERVSQLHGQFVIDSDSSGTTVRAILPIVVPVSSAGEVDAGG
jgi:signal transduction histidine kinase